MCYPDNFKIQYYKKIVISKNLEYFKKHQKIPKISKKFYNFKNFGNFRKVREFQEIYNFVQFCIQKRIPSCTKLIERNWYFALAVKWNNIYVICETGHTCFARSIFILKGIKMCVHKDIILRTITISLRPLQAELNALHMVSV